MSERAKAWKRLLMAIAVLHALFFTFVCLATAIVAVLTGAKWSQMDGQQRFLTVLMIFANWGTMMLAFLSRSAGRVAQGHLPIGDDDDGDLAQAQKLRAALSRKTRTDEDEKGTMSMTSMKRMMKMAVSGLVGVVMAVALTGCSSTPTRFDQAMFTVTNVPMVTVRAITNVVTVTNTVPVEVVRTNTLLVTNVLNEVIPTYVTVTNTVERQVVSQETNVTPAGATILVPQLAGRSGTGEAIVQGTGAVAGLWGFGALAIAVASGIGNAYQRLRNRQMAAAAVGMTQAAATANTVSGVLTQNIETLLEILKTTQGQQMAPLVKNYLMAHQTEEGVVQTVAQLVANSVDNQAAKESATAILRGLQTLKS